MTQRKPTTLLVMVQDETGSMHSIQEQTITAFNEYFAELLANSDEFGRVLVHAWQFSDAAGEERVRQLHQGPLAKVPVLTPDNYRPRGNTPLLDAVGTAMQQAESVKADRYLFVVQTDGYENASRDFTHESISKMVSAKEADERWTLVFMGAGVDNWFKAAASMGASAMSTYSYAAADTRTVSSSLSRASVDFLATENLSNKNIVAEVESEVKKIKGKTPN